MVLQLTTCTVDAIKRLLDEKEHMVEIKNCWEFKNCGREPGGPKADELGICPAATNKYYHGVNRGKAGGRFCWTINGTLCEGRSEEKPSPCTDCGFFQQVEQQEGRFFILEPHNLNRRADMPGQEFVVLEAKRRTVFQPRPGIQTNSPPAL